MSIILDCRTDEYYNQKYLSEKDAEFLKGYDFALELLRPLFSNLEAYYREFEFEDEDVNLARFLDKHGKIRDKLEEAVADWHENERDMLVTSMIDHMGEAEYKEAKKEIDGGVREPYFKEKEEE